MLGLWVGVLLFLASLAHGGAEEIVLAVRQPRGDHWYENFGHGVADANSAVYGAGGRLCKLDLDTGKVTVLLADPQGAVRDPQVHYDGDKILFSYRKGGTPYYHLYEIRRDGAGQMAYYGNSYPGDVYLDAKPIRGGSDIVMVNSPNHGRKEHEGRIAVVSSESGPDQPAAQRLLNPDNDFRDPYPWSGDSLSVRSPITG